MIFFGVVIIVTMAMVVSESVVSMLTVPADKIPNRQFDREALSPELVIVNDYTIGETYMVLPWIGRLRLCGHHDGHYIFATRFPRTVLRVDHNGRLATEGRRFQRWYIKGNKVEGFSFVSASGRNSEFRGHLGIAVKHEVDEMDSMHWNVSSYFPRETLDASEAQKFAFWCDAKAMYIQVMDTDLWLDVNEKMDVGFTTQPRVRFQLESLKMTAKEPIPTPPPLGQTDQSSYTAPID